MFRAIILPIFRSARLCVTVCGIMHPRRCQSATSWVHYTTSCNTHSNAPEDEQNNCPKHVELIGIINQPLLLHLVVCLHYLRPTNFRRHRTIYSRHGSLASGTCSNLTYAITVGIHQIRFCSAVYYSKSSVFCLSLTRHSEYFSKQHSQNGRHSDDGPYSLWRRNWIFICNSDDG